MGISLGGLLAPVSGIIEGVGGALGLSPETVAAVKVVVGGVMGNPVMITDGAMSLAKELKKKPPAQTEYRPSQSDTTRQTAGARDGYWPTSPGNQPAPSHGVSPAPVTDPKLTEYRDALRTLEANFAYLDGQYGMKDGVMSLADLQRLAQDPSVSPDLRKAAKFLADHRGYFERLETATRSGPLFDRIHNLVDGMNDDRFNLRNLLNELARVDAELRANPPPATGGTTPPTTGGGTTPPATGGTTPTTGGSTPPSGTPSTGGSDSTSGTGGTAPKKKTSTKDRVDQLLNSKLPIEQVVKAVLAEIMKDADLEIRDVMEEMAALRQDEAVLGTTAADKKKAAEIQSSLHDLQFRLQELTERRKQMFELMTNLSSKEHEMSRAAIANLGRA